ncbi:MAG: hypothetical protein ABSC25_12055 [Roseiarcus sp.]|jgi:hypothetical protein
MVRTELPVERRNAGQADVVGRDHTPLPGLAAADREADRAARVVGPGARAGQLIAVLLEIADGSDERGQIAADHVTAHAPFAGKVDAVGAQAKKSDAASVQASFEPMFMRAIDRSTRRTGPL